jgi:putative holliday junction resolvase
MTFNVIAALDLGDQWIGVAISDKNLIVASPDTTVEHKDLILFLHDYIKKHTIQTIVVGMPITLRGTESEQTRKTKAMLERLRKEFSEITFVTFDERFSSQQASAVQSAKKKTIENFKEDKLKSHAIAAAFILNNYLQMLAFNQIPD